MRVICISGKAGHGKDTFASLTNEALSGGGHRVLITHYADLVKYVAKTFYDWDGKKDEPGRTLLQTVGTEIFRGMDENYWVNFVVSVLKAGMDNWDYVLIPDCRFPNEIQVLKDNGFDVIHVRVVRPNHETSLNAAQLIHSSETSLCDSDADVLIRNAGTVEDLFKIVKDFLFVNFDIKFDVELKDSITAVSVPSAQEYSRIVLDDAAVRIVDSITPTRITLDGAAINNRSWTEQTGYTLTSATRELVNELDDLRIRISDIERNLEEGRNLQSDWTRENPNINMAPAN